MARVGAVLPVETFLLAGVVVSSFLGALVSLLLIFSHQQIARIVFWLMGNLSGARWDTAEFLLPYLALGVAGLYFDALSLNLLSLGEEQATMLGVEVERLKPRLVMLASLLTAAAVSSCGLIGFIGLVVPHAARGLVGADHRLLLPGSALLGASSLMLCDTLARSLVPGTEIPVGVVTALLGAPFFLLLLQRRRSL
jgi:iron complex transport system permease protein